MRVAKRPRATATALPTNRRLTARDVSRMVGGLENFYSSVFRRRRAPAPLTNAGARYDLLRALQPVPGVGAETDEPRTQEEQGLSLWGSRRRARRRHAHLRRRSLA